MFRSHAISAALAAAVLAAALPAPSEAQQPAAPPAARIAWGPLSLAAVGSYGRSMLSPFSDHMNGGRRKASSNPSSVMASPRVSA